MASNLNNPLFWYNFYKNYNEFTDQRFWSTDLLKSIFNNAA